MRKPGNFVVPKKGATQKEKKRTEPLHNPLAPGAFVLFNPTSIFSEKYAKAGTNFILLKMHALLLNHNTDCFDVVLHSIL